MPFASGTQRQGNLVLFGNTPMVDIYIVLRGRPTVGEWFVAMGRAKFSSGTPVTTTRLPSSGVLHIPFQVSHFLQVANG
jgi:hypothetical protein